MKKLIDNQAGASHIILVLLFVVALAGLVGFAYTRISDKNTETAQVTQDESVEDTSDDSENLDEANDEDPTSGMEADAAE